MATSFEIATVKANEKRGIDCGIEEAVERGLVSYCSSTVNRGLRVSNGDAF